MDSIRHLEAEIDHVSDGMSTCRVAPGCTPELQRVHLEDVLAFESVGSGTSLFEGLQKNGMDLPSPDTLNDAQSAEKAVEIMEALLRLQIIPIGFEHMSGRELYRTLWNETLWEGCYVKKRQPGAMTIIDVSHSMSRSEIEKYIASLTRAYTIQ